MAKSYGRKLFIRQIREPRRQDPYRSQSKPAGHSQCPKCRAICLKGQWIAESVFLKKNKLVEKSPAILCPACRQSNERYALGVVEIRGVHSEEHREDILKTIRNTENVARYRNDQKRVLWISHFRNALKVYVTLPDLARNIGKELERSFQGVSEFRPSTEEPYLRVRWWADFPHIGHQPGAPISLKRVLSHPHFRRFVRMKNKSRGFRSRSISKNPKSWARLSGSDNQVMWESPSRRAKIRKGRHG